MTQTRIGVTDNRAFGTDGPFGDTSPGEGGGTANLGALDLEQSAVSANRAEGSLGGVRCPIGFGGCSFVPGDEARGGASFSTGMLTIANSTVSGNLARGGDGHDLPPSPIRFLDGATTGGAGRGGGKGSRTGIAGACAKWMDDFDTNAKANGITDSIVTIGKPLHASATGDRG